MTLIKEISSHNPVRKALAHFPRGVSPRAWQKFAPPGPVIVPSPTDGTTAPAGRVVAGRDTVKVL